ncbi:MAG: hypothetical protein PVF74_05755 [Anaerolineales bacterium]|jgi:hypothetical protein
MFELTKTRFILSGLALLIGAGILYLVFAPQKLPSSGEEKLLKHVQEMTTNAPIYEIVSIEKVDVSSAIAVEEYGNQTFTGETNTVSGCPQINSGEEAWCVVLDNEIIDQNGIRYGHFLVKNSGWRWEVLPLSDEDSGVFDYFDCRNW